MTTLKKHSVDVLNSTYTFETGRLALQADGAVLVTQGETNILVAAGIGPAREGIDFFPLTVDFEPKYYATGKIKGSRFMKREARPPESAIITARMIDRTMRPLFNKMTTNEIQVIGTLLQSDGLRNVGPAAITGASTAIQLAGIPIESVFAGVRVGVDAQNHDFILDPTFEQIESGGLDLVVAGTPDAITMVEAGANLIPDEIMLEALAFAHTHIQTLCQAQLEFVAMSDVTPKEITLREDFVAEKEAVKGLLTKEDLDAISGSLKKEVKKGFAAAEEKIMNAFAAQIEAGELSKKGLMQALEKMFAANMRANVFSTGKRLDGRTATEVRALTCEVGVFNRLHGSALFQRGETQALTVATVGGPTDEKIIDDADRPEFTQQYIHHYNFPPYSVGEVRRLRSPGRREIGHGFLAQRALEPVIPQKADGFPYTLRIVSEILTCNGSSSMASVCGSTLSLMDAGVPIKTPISGVAMGLLMDADSAQYSILTDIQSYEDFDGDMDLKVTGSRDAITALQMDIKVKGLKIELLKEAFEQAKKARNEIMDAMVETIAEPRAEMSNFAPRVTSMMIDPEMIRVVIGKGGETIQGLCAEFDVKIDIEDSGLVLITSVNGENAKGAESAIKALVYEPEVGDIFENAIVKKVADFGVFVEYAPKKEALVHVSEMADHRVEHPGDLVSEGDTVKVKYMGADKMGRIRLSMKQA